MLGSKWPLYAQGRIPGTDRWKPINEELGSEEDGVLIVRIKDNLDFGVFAFRSIPSCVLMPSIQPILLS